MKHTVRLQEEISKHVSARKHITTQIEYFCDSEEDTKHLTQNITEVLTKHLGDYHPAEKKVEVVIIEHQ